MSHLYNRKILSQQIFERNMISNAITRVFEIIILLIRDLQHIWCARLYHAYELGCCTDFILRRGHTPALPVGYACETNNIELDNCGNKIGGYIWLYFLAVIFTATPTCDQRRSCSGNRVQMLRDQYLEETQNHLPRTWFHRADFRNRCSHRSSTSHKLKPVLPYSAELSCYFS